MSADIEGEDVWLHINPETANVDRQAELDARDRSAGRTWMAPPVLTIHGTGFYNPWYDDDGAA